MNSGGLVGYNPWGYKRVRHDSMTKQEKQLVSNILLVCVCVYISLSISFNWCYCRPFISSVIAKDDWIWASSSIAQNVVGLTFGEFSDRLLCS